MPNRTPIRPTCTPLGTRDLALPGRLLLWTARHGFVAGHRRSLPGFVRLTLDQLPDGAAIRCRAETLLAALAAGARRPMAFARPESERLGADEQALLLALEAARADLVPECRLALAELQARRGIAATVECALDLGRRLAARDLDVFRPAPCAVPSTPGAAGEASERLPAPRDSFASRS